MSSRIRLEQYLGSLRRRIRIHIYMRAAAVAAGLALGLTLATVWLLQRDGFPAASTMTGRLLLAFAIVAALALCIVLPLQRLRQRDGAREFERRLPGQQGRIETFLDARRREQADTKSPLLELLAGDALASGRHVPVRTIVPDSWLWSVAAVAVVALSLLVLLPILGPTYWGYGSRYLLLGSELPRDAVPLREVRVTPGDVTVRRNSDLTIRATTTGFLPDRAHVFVRFDDQQQWERAPMQVVDDGVTRQWQFRLYALRGPLHYYVAAEDARNAERSGEHAVAIVDLPRIERVRLTYHYPQWTGLPSQTEDVARDIRAVAGTDVKVEVFANAPLQQPVIVIDGAASAMQPTGANSVGNIPVAKHGSYHIGARVANELVALTDDYAIEIVNDEKPGVEIRKPARDWRATSIEEVPVSVHAQDDFRLQDVALRYAVNGGDWQTLPLTSGGRQADTESLLRMEEIGAAAGGAARKQANAPAHLEPGDHVTYYAVARDRNQSVQTDLFMVQVQPFERRFSEGQSASGGNGMDDEQGAISERQREILLATWNLQRSAERDSRSRAQLEESAQMLSELQTKLGTQARTLADRMRARMATDADERITQFVESLERAAEVMEPAAKYLNEFKLTDAVPVEQQALQQLLRAEAAFRDVQVAMQQQSAQGGQQSARNFTEMFELEMDVDKNHYETQSPLSQRTSNDELDEAIRKLKELAERQERLAQQMNRTQSAREQRWQQEQLRREAEDLQRRLTELTRMQNSSSQAEADRNQQSAGSSPQQSASRSNQSNSSPSRSGGQSQGQSASQSERALESMREAVEQMRAANSNATDERGEAQRTAQEAGRNLRQALQRMQQPRGEGMAEALDKLAARAAQLSAQQRRAEADLYEALGSTTDPGRGRGQLDPAKSQKLVDTKQQMANDIGAIQRDMRAALNDYRTRNPEATRRLAEGLSDLEAASLAQRLNRSAAEIRYGRARDAAPREGLIAEALENLERDLRASARIAAGESQRREDDPKPERLLAELGDLRRALQAGRENSLAPSDAGSQREQGTRAAGADGNARNQGQGEGENLSLWDPQGVPSLNSLARENGVPLVRPDEHEVGDIARRLEAMTNRPAGLQLSQAEIAALRRLTHDARRLNDGALDS
ncbi:MAG TPA: hypothetical protein VKB34_22685, partial [Povalibacter sp.]|nr:hypothetical protein [Povalibacter sp.]